MSRRLRRRTLGPHHLADAVRPEINVTPLVDVVLVLLITFMVVAPRLEQDIPVDLPRMFRPDPESRAVVDPIRVSIPAAGELYFGEERFDLPALIDRLAQVHAEAPDRRLLVRADQDLTYGDVRPLLEKTQAIGFPGFSFVVSEKVSDSTDQGKSQWR